MAHIIVLGNEKGGSGKSTTAMHIATALVRFGHSVGALDLDLRQRSFHRYIENRQQSVQTRGLGVPVPILKELPEVDEADLRPGHSVWDKRLGAAIADLEPRCDFVVIDCPGSHTRLSQIAHSLADTLVTPLNDSFVDFDMLARVDPQSFAILGPSVYSEMVWKARQARSQAGLPPVDWVVARNRVSAQQMHNKRKVGGALDRLAHRIGFRVITGFSERVIFRELFPSGLTLLDLRSAGSEKLSVSNIAARQELRDLMKGLNLPGVTVDI